MKWCGISEHSFFVCVCLFFFFFFYPLSPQSVAESSRAETSTFPIAMPTNSAIPGTVLRVAAAYSCFEILMAFFSSEKSESHLGDSWFEAIRDEKKKEARYRVVLERTATYALETCLFEMGLIPAEQLAGLSTACWGYWRIEKFKSWYSGKLRNPISPDPRASFFSFSESDLTFLFFPISAL